MSDNNAFVFLHCAELSLHLSEFDQALGQLRQAQHKAAMLSNANSRSHSSAYAYAAHAPTGVRQLLDARRAVAIGELQANIYALQAAATARSAPESPEVQPHFD